MNDNAQRIPFLSPSVAIVANGAEMKAVAETMGFCLCEQGAVYCDRAPLTWRDLSSDRVTLPPTLQIVGDLDTLEGDYPAELLTDLHEDQESNDLTKAFRWVEANVQPELIEWFCVTGKREDHTLANLALIASFGVRGKIYTQSGCFYVLPAGEWSYACVEASPISFLSFVPQVITATGLRWRVDHLLLDTLWRATLNQTAADCVNVRCEAPLLIFQPWRTPCEK
ncbi:MAG: hypothetical protein RSD41_00280 [Kiritimatiellia bacterium]